MLIKNHAALRDATDATSKSLGLARLMLALSITLCTLQAHAGRPMLTDDATIVEQCQLESWAQRERTGTRFWAVPACQLLGVEWALGVAKTPAGEPQQYEFSAKTELKTLQTNSYGITAQLAYQFDAGQQQQGDLQLNLALTQSFAADTWLLHLNAGRLHREQAHNDWTAGIALQHEFAANQWLFTELYRENAGRPVYQLGYLAEVLPNRLQLDLSYGNRVSRSGREDFLSAGLAFYFSVL
ncbi:hypothetical protein WG68_10135 [Arsukibacterium ikkense]|uniref:Uncharacterized protein n=1 Tax=Arsukibacterium ikkense TaxID=336831 RepID=A0A0M2V6V4_9GAMM|nr:hypothetical protein [Arsukibacterium ikkense]KKO45405.1 hypothetical protein WG68_10135 [Arsukibacterium ikkense]